MSMSGDLQEINQVPGIFDAAVAQKCSKPFQFKHFTAKVRNLTLMAKEEHGRTILPSLGGYGNFHNPSTSLSLQDTWQLGLHTNTFHCMTRICMLPGPSPLKGTTRFTVEQRFGLANMLLDPVAIHGVLVLLIYIPAYKFNLYNHCFIAIF